MFNVERDAILTISSVMIASGVRPRVNGRTDTLSTDVGIGQLVMLEST